MVAVAMGLITWQMFGVQELVTYTNVKKTKWLLIYSSEDEMETDSELEDLRVIFPYKVFQKVSRVMTSTDWTPCD